MSNASDAHPAVDVVTAKSAVVIQDRPLVPLSSWLTDAMAQCANSGLAFQLLTSRDARITLPLRMTLGGPKARWVVQEPESDGYFDGFSGFPLAWDGGVFGVDEQAAASGPSVTFTRKVEEDRGHHLIVSLRMTHEATSHLQLGRTVEDLAKVLAGAAPLSWGTAEPALSRWSPSELTDLCRRRSPQATWLVFMGPHGTDAEPSPFGGTVRVSRVTSGIKETIAFGVVYPADRDPPLDDLAELADGYARAGTLQTLNAQWTPGLPDLTYPSRWIGAPVPVALGLGPNAIAETGIEHALAAEVSGAQIGDPGAPGMWYVLGDGEDTRSWTRLGDLMNHLTKPGGTPLSPETG